MLKNHKIEPQFDQYLARTYRISNSYGTVRSYLTALNKFQKFCDTKSNLSEMLYELKNNKLDPVDLLDDFYTYMSHQRIKNRTIIGYLSIVKDYLNFHGMHIYAEDIKQKFRPPRPEVFFEVGLTKSVLNRLLQNCVPKLRVAILIACSSGMRIGEIVQLKKSDIDFTTSPTTIKIRRETTKTRETRFTHLTAEASKALCDYLTKNKIDSNSDDPFLFMHLKNENDPAAYYKSMFSARQTFMEKLRKTTDSIHELSTKNENGQNNIHFHAFRKWFKTQVTTAGQSDFAEALMGHKSLKLIYFKQSSEARMKLYQKMESFLTLSDYTKVEQSMEEMQTQIESLTMELEKVKQWRDVAIKYT